MNLYEIEQAVLDCVDPETGEIVDPKRLESLYMAKSQKIENVGCWAKNLRAEIAAIREEEHRLARRRKAMERKTASLEKYLADALAGRRFESARCAVTFRTTRRVEVTDTRAAAKWAIENNHGSIVTYAAPAVNKTELAKLLRSGERVPGCELVEGQSMQIK